MGVLNITSDSFSDGGIYLDFEAAVRRGRQMVAEGADVVDVGGESTRPGATAVTADEELRRVVPVVEALAGEVRVSIDTTKASVAHAALAAGATLLNDVSSSLAAVASEHGAGYVALHCKGTPADMQRDPHYDDVVSEVGEFLELRAADARAAGVGEVYVDPGIGFGKSVRHNLQLLAALPRLVATSSAILAPADPPMAVSVTFRHLGPMTGWRARWPRPCGRWPAGRPLCGSMMSQPPCRRPVCFAR